MFEELNQHRAAVAEQIQKACEIGFTGNELEKAHNVGDIHPNGKWVWTQLPSGRYDWRVIKKTGAGSGGSTPATAQKTAQSGKKESVSISANHPSLASVPGVQNIKDALTTYNSKYTDLSKVELIKTPKGNWDLHYDGHRLGIIAGSSISDRNAAKMGWIREGTDDLTRSKRDAEEEKKQVEGEAKKKEDEGGKKETGGVKSGMKPKELDEAVNEELDALMKKDGVHNDSPEWRKGAYEIYKKYKEAYPNYKKLKTTKAFDDWFTGSYQEVRQGIKMKRYLKEREKGATHGTAEKEAKEYLEAVLRSIR